MPAPHHLVFTGRMPFLPPNQQRQSTEGNNVNDTCTASEMHTREQFEQYNSCVTSALASGETVATLTLAGVTACRVITRSSCVSSATWS